MPSLPALDEARVLMFCLICLLRRLSSSLRPRSGSPHPLASLNRRLYQPLPTGFYPSAFHFIVRLQAFVIYTFFSLLLLYLGGARSLLTLLHSSLRPPTPHPFPFNLVLHDLDLSDPHSYLALKRGVLQYCVIKPILAIVTVGLKLGEVYDEGQIGVGTGYTWVSVVYNASICLSL